MKEFDLDHIWKEADADADQYYQQIAPELEEKAQKQSTNILNRVQRALWVEIVGSVFAAAYFFISISLPIHLKVILEIIMIAIIGFLLYYSFRFRRLLKDLQLRPSLEVLEVHLEVLTKFIRQMKLYYIIGIPLGFLLGMTLPFFLDGEFSFDLKKALVYGGMILVSIPFLYFIIKLTNEKYVYYLYTRKRDELQEIYDQLRDQ
ncbi:MAG: hypothetical protein AAF388_21365 [Bacteroidota bacterium]